MERRLREKPRWQQFQTTNLPLGAAILATVSGSSLREISPTSSVDGKRVISIGFLADQETEVSRVVEAFLQRRLTIDLYAYNRCLNLLRDRLRQGEKTPCRSATPS